jgi:hypothetical protein
VEKGQVSAFKACKESRSIFFTSFFYRLGNYKIPRLVDNCSVKCSYKADEVVYLVKTNSGIIKRILKDHFDGFWKMQSNRFPESFREDIKETVEKAIRCGTRDLGFARYE